jgi:hypothetical protein
MVTQTIAGCTSAPANVMPAPLTVPGAPSVTVLDSCGTSLLTTTTLGTVLWSTNETSNSIYVGAGTYTVTQTVGGCVSPSQSAIAAPFAGPSVSFSPLSDVCINAPMFSLSGGSPTGGTYSGTGVSANQFDPSAAGIGTFTITYDFTDVNGCSDQSQQTILVGCADIANLESSTFLVFPNPSSGVLTISTTDTYIKSVLIYDGIGKLVAVIANEKVSTEQSIDLSSFARGVYSLEISTDKFTSRNKIILAD